MPILGCAGPRPTRVRGSGTKQPFLYCRGCSPELPRGAGSPSTAGCPCGLCIDQHSVPCLLSGRVLTTRVCVYACVSVFDRFFLDLEFYFIAVKTLCYIMFIYFKICAKRGCIFNKKL